MTTPSLQAANDRAAAQRYPTRHLQRLKDERWLALRQELVIEAGYKCKACSLIGRVHVHHGYYQGDMFPWDYPRKSLHVYCPEHHGIAQALMTEMNQTIGCLDIERYQLVLSFARAIADGAQPLEAALGRGALVLSR